jgi:ech hydrogenase subunit B
MIDLLSLMAGIALWALVPLLIGLLLGADRVLTARLQGRQGPTVLQPLRDIAKLLGKGGKQVNVSQVVFAYMALALQAVAALILLLGGDILVALLLSGAGSFVLVLGALSVRSPYSHVGAHRELLQILATEPVLLLLVLTLGYANGSFLGSDMGDLLVATLPLAVIALVPTFLIRLEKSPYDIATAHSEVVSGPYIEYSGSALGVTKLAHWFELAVLFGLLMLFFDQPDPLLDAVLKVSMVLVMVFAVALIDNSTARSTRWNMLRFTLAFGLGAIALNLFAIYMSNTGVI